MLLKLEDTNRKLPNDYTCIKITDLITGKITYKHVDEDIKTILANHKCVYVANLGLAGYRRIKLNDIKIGPLSKTGYSINRKSAMGGWLYICKKGLKSLGFQKFDYIYVRFGRKVTNASND